MPTVLKYLSDDGVTWLPFTGDVVNAGSSIVVKGAPIGLVNNSNLAFTTAVPYIGGTLQVYVNGWAQSEFITETDPATGAFSLDVAPGTGSSVRVYFHVKNTAMGNSDALQGYSLQGILDAIYPIGATYVSGTATMPPLIAGIGTWARLNGRVIVGLDETQAEFDTVNETGGHKLMQAHKHRLRVDTSASDGGWLPPGSTNVNAINAGSTAVASAEAGKFTDRGGTTWVSAAVMENTGGGNSENLQPYKVKYMWERTA